MKAIYTTLLKLKPSQKKEGSKYFKVTIKGETKDAENYLVKFHSESLEEAQNFEVSEVDGFKITEEKLQIQQNAK